MDNPSADPIVAELRAIRQELTELRREQAERFDAATDANRESLAGQRLAIANQEDSIGLQRQGIEIAKNARVSTAKFLKVFLWSAFISLVLYLVGALLLHSAK